MKVPARPDLSLPELPAPPEEKLLLPPHSHRSKLFMLMLIIFIGIGIYMLFFTLQGAKDKKAYPVTQMPTITPLLTQPADEWQTYTNITDNYIIKYPKKYMLTPPAPGNPDPGALSIKATNLPANTPDFVLTISPKEVPGTTKLQQPFPTINPCPEKAVILNQSLKNKNNVPEQNCIENLISVTQLINNGMIYTITVSSTANYSDIRKYVDDILTTFTFINSKVISPSPENNTGNASGMPVQPKGKLCTMESKQCPDGSWVGRTGPNCAFAACPAK